MSLFRDWNYLLLGEYFSPSSSGEEVWVQASRQELDSFGLHLGGADGLVEAVRLGVPWMASTGANSAEVALHLARLRRARLRPTDYIDPGAAMAAYSSADAPTYLPILALWVLASSEAEDGFYAKVSDLLGQPFPNTPQLTNAMSQVWEDLELWSAVECGARFGAFRRRVLGEHRFVGIPRSQCLVSRRDDRGLRQLFVACGLRPGQAMTPGLMAGLADLGRDAHYLSRGLRSAFGMNAFQEQLAHMLGKALQSWDGRRPESTGIQQVSHSGRPHLAEEFDCTTLALVPAAGDADGWDIQWRFRSPGQGNACFLIIDDTRIQARLEPWANCFGTQAGGQQQEFFRAILARTGTSDVVHGVEHSDEEGPELGGGTRNGRIARRPVRTLAWDTPDPRLGEELVERELPIAGPLYLVCSSSNRGNLERYLRNERIEYTSMAPKGLPSGWTLTCIPQAERLTTAQRHWLSDEDEVQVAAARLRFVGGRPILRGGSRLYASYDLPVVEMEAPAGATVDGEGMRFEELQPHGAKPVPTPIRRFRIQSWDHERSVFEIKVIDSAHQVLAVAKLRMSAPEGAGIGRARSFSIDPLGRARHDDLGMRGANIGGGEHYCRQEIVGVPLQEGRLQGRGKADAQPHDSISARFLDSLAQLGSIGYGEARKQLFRLAEAAGLVIEPVFLLLDLRSRAHLEIETDAKGHLVRVHSVPPALYSLPATCDGLPLAGVCGSLRTQHWIEISRHAGCIAFCEAGADGRLPTLRLAVLGEEEMREVAQECGFRIESMPCDAVSNWASSLDHARTELASWGWGSFSAELRQLQRLQPNSARFCAVQSCTMIVDQAVRCQLFRFDDPSAPGLQVYVLGTIEASGSTRYSFIHDSRWGVWITEIGFARMLRERLSREDVHPWPIHYDRDRRELWLPARIKPPVVIERALTLSSGSGPREVRVIGILAAGHLGLVDQDSGMMLGGASLVYESFAPGTWLCYEWVPQEIAIRVASLLGGEIRPFF